MTLLVEHIGSMLSDINLSGTFLDLSLQARETKAKINKRLGQAKTLFQCLLWQHVYNTGVIQRRLAWPPGKMIRKFVKHSIF